MLHRCMDCADPGSQALLSMREFVYISNRKLTQFMPDAPPPWWRRKLLRAEIKTPLGSIGVDAGEASPDDIPASKLSEVIRDIEAHARWYEESDLEIGEWIFFEVKLAYHIIDENDAYKYTYNRRRQAGRKSRTREDQPAAVVFVSADSPIQLMLHGAAKHLAGHQSSRGADQVFWSEPSDSLWLPKLLGTLAAFAHYPGSQGTSGETDPADSSFLQSVSLFYDSGAVSAELFRRVCGYIGQHQRLKARWAP